MARESHLQIFARFLQKHLDKCLRETDIVTVKRFAEERGDFFVPEARNAAAYARHVEEQLRVLPGEGDELIHIGFDGLHAPLHGGDGVALAAETNAAAHHGTELTPGDIRCAAAVHSGEVASEHEDFIGLQLRYIVRGEIRTLNSIVRSHNWIRR